MRPENKSEKRKAESGKFPERTIGGAAASFPAAIFLHCRQLPTGGCCFRFPLSAFRLCL